MKRSLRRQALEEWRGLPEPSEEKERMVLVRDVLTQLAPKLGLEERLREDEINRAWAEIVGEFFSKHSRPSRLRQGTLVVNVLQPTVLYELERQWKTVVVEKLKARFGKRMIRQVRFRLG